jgi:hypothetical protein
VCKARKEKNKCLELKIRAAREGISFLKTVNASSIIKIQHSLNNWIRPKNFKPRSGSHSPLTMSFRFN